MAAHRREGGILQGVALAFQSPVIHAVVGIHARHEWGPAVACPALQRRDEPAPRFAQDAEARISPREVRRDLRAGVAGPIVDDHALEAGLALSRDAAQASAQGGFGVAHRQQHGDPGFAHSITKKGLDQAAPPSRCRTRM